MYHTKLRQLLTCLSLSFFPKSLVPKQKGKVKWQQKYKKHDIVGISVRNNTVHDRGPGAEISKNEDKT